MRIAIDTLGGEAPLADVVAGALAAVADTPATLAFFGDARALEPLVTDGAHEIVDAPRRLEVDDPLRTTLRGGVPSSMRSAIGALAAGDADAMVSGGGTGGLMALSRHLVGTLPGIRRPAIVKTMAAQEGRSFRMLDLGANVGVDPAQLHQFARMGVAAASAADVAAPTVALLNIGSELRKGPPAVRAAARLLAEDARLRDCGFIEPDRAFAAGLDVVVADGYAGNIALKAVEGALRLARYLLDQELARELAREEAMPPPLAARLERLRAAYNPQRYNGAVLLGLAKVVVKSHGGADRQGFAAAVRQAAQALAADLTARVAAGVRASGEGGE